MSERYKVIIVDLIGGDLEPERRILEQVADVTALGTSNEDELVGQIEDADAIMLYHDNTFSRRTIERLRRCKLIVRCGVGFDNVDAEFARSRSIDVANVPDYGTEEVADTAIALMMSLVRGTHFHNSQLRAGLGWSYQQIVPLPRLRGQVFAVVGLGRIGTAAAVRAKAVGMEVLFCDPYKPDGYDKALGMRRVEQLDALLEQAYVLSVHCPLTDETRKLIDAAALGKMRQGTYLVNTARGAVVDTSAVADAIASGQLAGAGIDVFECEPADDKEPLVQAWRDPEHPAYHRVILNPHAAFYSEEGLMDIRQKSAQTCLRALTGKLVRNIVN